MRSERLGRLFVQGGLVSDKQADQLITQIAQREPHAAGAAIAQAFGIEETQVWEACAAQLVCDCPYVHLQDETLDSDCLSFVKPADAWDCLVLPLRKEAGELICATTQETLASAIALLQQTYQGPFRFVLAPLRPMEQFIAERYGYEGIDLED